MIKKMQSTPAYCSPECTVVGIEGLKGVCLVAASADGTTESLDSLVDFNDYLNS